MTPTPQRPIAEAPPRGLAAEDASLVEALRRGDEAAFAELVGKHHRAMVRLARLYAGSDGAAEDAVQEAWLGVLRGLPGFEGRSSLKAWIFRIAVLRARSRGLREARTVPLSALEPQADDGPAVDPGQFQGPDGAWPGAWERAPEPWPEERLASAEAARLVRAEIERLPPGQRAVITLRDVEGLDSEEACAVLGISEGNQRVLLHRARSKVRAALEGTLAGEGT